MKKYAEDTRLYEIFLKNIFQSLFMLYYIIKLSRSLYIVSIVQSTSQNSTEPPYSYKLHSYKKW